MLKDAFNRLIKAFLINEVRSDRKTYADVESIKTFETNLRELLLSPAGMKPTPIQDFGLAARLLSSIRQVNFWNTRLCSPLLCSRNSQADRTIKNLIEKHIELIAIGNGTLDETDEFISEVLKTMERKPIKVMVNESGASILFRKRGSDHRVFRS